MKIGNALRDGLGRLNRAKKIIGWLYLANFLLALAPALILSQQIERSVSHSAVAENLQSGWDQEWLEEFHTDSWGLPKTFDASVSGAGAVFKSLDSFVSGSLFGEFTGVVAVGCLILLLWTFTSGGIVTAYHRQQSIGLAEFLANSGRFFGPLFRILLLSGVAYWIIFAGLYPLADSIVESLTRETIDERVMFAWVVAKYLVLLTVLFSVNLLFDYTRILCVIGDRRSAWACTKRAAALISRNPLPTFGLYMTIGIVGLVLAGVYAGLAPGIGQTSYLGVAWALFLGQLFILTRVWLRLFFLSSQTALAEELG